MSYLIILVITGFVMIGLTFMFFYLSDNYSTLKFFSLTMSIVSGIVALSIWCIIGFGSYFWLSSEHKAKIINREYKTDYTAEEVFFATAVIDTIQQIKRQRIEVNGNLLKDKK